MKWQRERAKQRWLQNCDKNAKFFYKCATQRKQDNVIHKISNGARMSITGQEEISRYFSLF